jgi:hypothetical protein
MERLDRRAFLGGTLGGMALTLGSGTLLLGEDRQKPAKRTSSDKRSTFKPDTLFLTWQRDPTTTMTVQWVGKPSETDSTDVSFAPQGQTVWRVATPRERPYPMTDLRVFRAELTGLTPGTEYQFRIGEQSPTYRFRSMPAKATDAFRFISGGDCGVNPHAVANNAIAAKQDPMFALIGGDLGYDDGKKVDVSLDFVRNYSRTMIDSEGRLIPMVVCIGNHEVAGGFKSSRKDGPFFFALHDGLYAERTFAKLDFGDYLSLVLLDTDHVARIEGEQTDWLHKALRERTDIANLIVVNHVPAYPSYRLPSGPSGEPGTGEGNRTHWAPLFEKYDVDVVLEHHDHTFKRTHPIRDGHIDKDRGILYLGDGSWGKLRAPVKPEDRPYLAKTSQNYHLTLHSLEGEQRFHMAIEETGKVIDICSTAKKSRRKP